MFLPVKEYDLFVPLNYNDGTPVEPEKLNRLKRLLVEEFGGLTHFPQENEGLWKIGNVTFRDKIVILRLVASNSVRADDFLAALKPKLQEDWRQADFLIVSRAVTVL